MKRFDYQIEGKEFIAKVGKTYIAFDMGMGKTITSLDGVIAAGTKNILLVAEKNEIVNSENFRKEVETHFPHIKYLSLREVGLEEVELSGERCVCGINPDGLVKLDPKKIPKLFDSLVMDEATLAKTTTTLRFKAVKKIAKVMKYVVLLSGTPMMNGASELYAPLLLLGHWLGGAGKAKDRMDFETIFAGGYYKRIKYTGTFWIDFQWWAKGANHVRELRWLIDTNFFFKQKGDTKVFKRKERRIELVPMTGPWITEYEKAWDEYIARVKEENKRVNVSKLKDLDNITELRNLIENGQVYQVNSKWKARQIAKDISKGKYGKKRIIVFSMFIETDSIFQKELEYYGVSYRTFDEVNEWKNGDEQVLVGRIKSHAKGGNVPEASVTIFIDMDFVPTMNLQAENRMDRPEQLNDMEVIYYMASGPGDIDQHVQKINKDKMRKIEEFMRPFTTEEFEVVGEKVKALFAKYPKEFGRLKGAFELSTDKS